MAARGRTTALEERVRAIAERFVEEMVRAVREGLAEEMATVVRSATRGSERLAIGGEAGDKRLGKRPVPVTCPVDGCNGPGLRAKRNFCADHAAELTDREKHTMRSSPKRLQKK